ncbi:MAG: alginate lyase family protein [Planctomycetota bacterium]
MASLTAIAGCGAATAGTSAVKQFTDRAVAENTDGILLRHADFAHIAEAIEEEDPAILQAVESVTKQAELAMEVLVRPVTSEKDEHPERLAPTGDPQDYVSLSPYWWPDPDVPSGVPYIRRDGEVNPERDLFDSTKMAIMGTAVRSLAWGYLATGDDRYAERAAEHLRAWFITPDTRMNPHVKFAQFVPGVSPGRPWGVIDTLRVRWVPDAAHILLHSKHWTEEDHKALRQWFSEYVDWLLTSDNGLMEQRAHNNHGTWYDAQVSIFSVFAGREELARERIEHSRQRMETHFASDGSQPHELERTRSLHYTEFNIRAYMDVATIAQLIGDDLLGHTTENGASIRVALDFAEPYFAGEDEWRYQQIGEPRQYMFFQTLRRAARLYDDPAYEESVCKLAPLGEKNAWMGIVLPAIHDIECEPAKTTEVTNDHN